jgi:hypothetical protein
MTETFNLVNQDTNTFVFYYTGNWVTWEKPKNCKFIYILCIGGGGGGGGGQSGSNIPRTGASGGSGSSSAICLFMANTLPDTLYIFVGNGGSGGNSNSNGTDGVVSKVSISRNDYAPFIQNIIASGRQDAPAGQGGRSDGVAVGGFGHIPGFYPLRDLGFNKLSGTGINTSGTGGSNLGGNGGTITINYYTSGGGGGGGTSSGNTDGNGGSVVSYVTLPGGLSGGTNNGASGLGITQFDENVSPYNGVTFLGGAGGGANGLGTGGNGGNGDFGCGGGGGGAGLIGGSGGKGGDGLVIIYTW